MFAIIFFFRTFGQILEGCWCMVSLLSEALVEIEAAYLLAHSHIVLARATPAWSKGHPRIGDAERLRWPLRGIRRNAENQGPFLFF